jgi:adenine-specific DNA-methyltransferase
MARPQKTSSKPKKAESYRHPDADLPVRPEIGAQAHFKKSKPAGKYRFDSSLAPDLNWDGQNPAREQAEKFLADGINHSTELGKHLADLKKINAADLPQKEQKGLKETITAIEKALAGNREALQHLKTMSGPFLNWSGKAERLSFEVPTLPLFVHERLSTTAILETLKGHKRDKQDDFLEALYGFHERPLADQLLRAYEYRDDWVNRLILGDSLVVMNSLLRYESLGGQVQMIYMDPPYGVKFGSNFQPFVRKRDVDHNDDDDMTREPEMVQAYRDTWELGLHSYLTYLRDRLLLARELLASSGSVFVQISDENLHHVRELMDEVFGAEHFCCIIAFRKTSGANSPQARVNVLATTNDFILWYAKDSQRLKYNQLYLQKDITELKGYNRVESPDGKSNRALKDEELANPSLITPAWRVYQTENATSTGHSDKLSQPFIYEGKSYTPPAGSHWKTTPEGMKRLAELGRLVARGNTLNYKRYLNDFAVYPMTHVWQDISLGYASDAKFYVVQTSSEVVQRCLLMTTDPGDLVLDPTCGSGTTAFVAEQWGRRWVTCDTSRVPLALARQRLLTATFDYYELKDEARGPAAGFVYKRKQNQKGEEVGGIVPHITLKSIANNEPPAEEVLVDRPEVKSGIVRVAGPFSFEATIPTAHGLDGEPPKAGSQGDVYEDYAQRMLEVLRKAPVLRLPGNQTVTLKNIRPPAKTLALSAEAVVDRVNLANLADDASKQPALARDSDAVAILFGPENGPLSERLVREAWDEAGLKHYSHLYVIGFAIDPKARQFIDSAGKIGVPCVYLQATMDLQMGDLLKNMRSSQIFSVCGLPDATITRVKSPKKGDEVKWQVELTGLDTFDPVTMEADHLKGTDLPAWFLDTDYNGMVFRVGQAFFPRTGAWENLKKALKMDFEETVWEHLAGTTSAPFVGGEHRQVAVKVIDPRGNELLVVKKLEEAK